MSAVFDVLEEGTFVRDTVLPSLLGRELDADSFADVSAAGIFDAVDVGSSMSLGLKLKDGIAPPNDLIGSPVNGGNPVGKPPVKGTEGKPLKGQTASLLSSMAAGMAMFPAIVTIIEMVLFSTNCRYERFL